MDGALKSSLNKSDRLVECWAKGRELESRRVHTGGGGPEVQSIEIDKTVCKQDAGKLSINY